MSHLVWYEVKRSLRPAQALPVLGLAMALCYQEVHGPWGVAETQVQGALTRHGEWLLLAIPFQSAAMGSSLADERRRGITLTILARGVSRDRYLLSKLLGAAASGASITAAAIGLFYGIVGVLWPAGRISLQVTEGWPGPAPALFAVSPLLHDLLVAGICLSASAGLPLVGTLAGTLTTNRYIAMAAPLVLMILGAVLQNGPLRLLNPISHLQIWGFYTAVVPGSMRLYAAFVYWLGFALLLAALCRWAFARKELS